MWQITPGLLRPERSLPLESVNPSAVAYGRGAVWVLGQETRTLTRYTVPGGDVRTVKLAGTPVDVAVGGGSVWVSFS